MEKYIYNQYVAILQEELVPAMGCTEPIAIAYAAALARQTLGCRPQRVEVKASANIIKNVKSVVVPNTGSLRGIAAAAAAGIVAGRADDQLQVLSKVTEAEVREIAEALCTMPISVEQSDLPYVFDIQVRVEAGADHAFCQIAGYHTNVIMLSKNDEVIRQSHYEEQTASYKTDRGLLTINSSHTLAK